MVRTSGKKLPKRCTKPSKSSKGYRKAKYVCANILSKEPQPPLQVDRVVKPQDKRTTLQKLVVYYLNKLRKMIGSNKSTQDKPHIKTHRAKSKQNSSNSDADERVKSPSVKPSTSRNSKKLPRTQSGSGFGEDSATKDAVEVVAAALLYGEKQGVVQRKGKYFFVKGDVTLTPRANATGVNSRAGTTNDYTDSGTSSEFERSRIRRETRAKRKGRGHVKFDVDSDISSLSDDSLKLLSGNRKNVRKDDSYFKHVKFGENCGGFAERLKWERT